jgi:hypothetical protein
MPYERTRLTHVAIRFRGVVYSLPAPNRHHHVLSEILRQCPNVDHVDDDEQGFLDEAGTFLNRRQALVSAELFKQIKPGTVIRAGQLFSEDVW